MLEFLTGTGLALAAGVNAYIPLLAIGLASRFLEFVQLPDAWQWLENEWVIGILAVLLVVEFFADKIPIVDHVAADENGVRFRPEQMTARARLCPRHPRRPPACSARALRAACATSHPTITNTTTRAATPKRSSAR